MNRISPLPLDRRRRSAFTLLELVIATSLVVTMLLIVWSLFSIYTKLERKGDRLANEMQLARSLFVQFRSDLQRLTTSPDHATSFSSAPQFSPGASGTTSIENDTGLPGQLNSTLPSLGDRQRPAALPRVGFLRGDSRSLTMIVSYDETTDRDTSETSSPALSVTPSPDFVGTVESNDEYQLSAPQPVWEVITYDFRPPPSAAGSPFENEGRSEAEFGEAEMLAFGSDGEADDRLKSQLAVGLTRRTQSWLEWAKEQRISEGNRLGQSFAVTGDTPDVGNRGDMDNAGLLNNVDQFDNMAQFDDGVDEIPEVTNFRLRYFDGRVWVASWDSDSRDGIPVAVEVFYELDGSRQWPREPDSEEGLEEFTGRDNETTIGADTEFSDSLGGDATNSIAGASESAITSGPDGLETADEMELIGYRFVILLRQPPNGATRGDTP